MNQLLITLPADIEFGDDFDFVFDLGGKSDVREAADDYLEGLERFSRGGITFDEGVRLRDAYVEQLANTMSKKLRMKKSWIAAKGLSDLLLAGVTSPLHFAAGWLLSFGLDPLRNRLIERMLKARVANALRREGLEAASAGVRPDGSQPVPLARSMGLYLGPLRPDGMTQLVRDIDPHPDARPLSKTMPNASPPGPAPQEA
jgi:hypothetical protein